MEFLGLEELRIIAQQEYIVKYMKYDKKQLIELLKIREKEKLLSIPNDLFNKIISEFLTLNDKMIMPILCKNIDLRINFIQNEKNLIKIGINKYFNNLLNNAKSISTINDEFLNIHQNIKFFAKFIDNNTNYDNDYKSKFREIFFIYHNLEEILEKKFNIEVSIKIRIMQLEVLVLLKQLLYNQPMLLLKILNEINDVMKLDYITDEQSVILINYTNFLKNVKVINKKPIMELCFLCNRTHSLSEFDNHI